MRPESATQGAREGRRILVIEDHADAARSLQMLLGLGGHEVRVVYRGKEGVRAAMEWAPDCICCDLGMPGMDGFEVARALKGHPHTAHIPLIAVTGYGDDGTRRRAAEVGFDGFLTKAADPEALLRLFPRADGDGKG
jgi:CheY-like chemotaxis protein